jgi:hypothetical protein
MMRSDLCVTHPRDSASRLACAERVTSNTPGAVWDHVIRALRTRPEAYRAIGERRSPRSTERAPRGSEAQTGFSNAQIEVLERLSSRTITILWQDATRCRYVDQVWTRCRARVIGRCSITGAAIGRNDIVFKPRARGEFPGNARAMILASSIPGLPEMDDESQLEADGVTC